eukprot:3335861-Pyramimonas_sp.AAC.1
MLLDRQLWAPATVPQSTSSDSTWFSSSAQAKAATTNKGCRIDYMCCSRGFEIINGEVLEQLDLTRSIIGHKPVHACLRFPFASEDNHSIS